MFDKGLIERLQGVLKESFVRLPYTEGIKILTFITAQEKITDLIGELALLNGKSREKNNPKGWIINALKGKIKDK